MLLTTCIKLAAYLGHVRRADGSWPADWIVARLALDASRHLLHQHLTRAELPHALTIAAYAASEDLRANRLLDTDWEAFQAQVIRVVPVVQRLLRTLATTTKGAA